MNILEIDVADLRAQSVECTTTELIVTLRDGRRIATPLDWYPRLKNASPAQRAITEIMPMGIHWPEIDEDLSVVGMMRGNQAITRADNPEAVQQKVPDELTRLFAFARMTSLTKEQLEEQRVSFVFGNLALDKKYITRAMVTQAAQALRVSNG